MPASKRYKRGSARGRHKKKSPSPQGRKRSHPSSSPSPPGTQKSTSAAFDKDGSTKSTSAAFDEDGASASAAFDKDGAAAFDSAENQQLIDRSGSSVAAPAQVANPSTPIIHNISSRLDILKRIQILSSQAKP
jgi:hypothetical protein